MKNELIFILTTGLAFFVAVAFAPVVARFVPLPSDNKPNFSEALEALRGVASFAVFGAHVTMYFSELTPRYVASSFLGSFGVIIFFMLTGHLFWSQIRSGAFDAGRFFEKRLFRLAPLCFVVVAVVTLLDWRASGFVRPNFEHLLRASRNFGFGFYVPVQDVFTPDMQRRLNTIWSLRWEWLFYFALPLLASLRYLRWVTLLGVFLTFVFYDPRELFRLAETEASFLLAFYLGIVSTYVPPVAARVSLSLVGMVAFLAAMGVYALMPDGMREPKVRHAVFVLISSIPFFVFVLNRSAPPRWMRWRGVQIIGKISYSLYLWQLVVIFYGMRIMDRFVSDPMTKLLLGFVILTPAIVVISLLSFRFVELPPLRWKIRQWPSRNQPATSAGPSP